MASLLPWQPSFPHHNITHMWHWCVSFSQTNNVSVNNLIKPRRNHSWYSYISAKHTSRYRIICDGLPPPLTAITFPPRPTIILHTFRRSIHRDTDNLWSDSHPFLTIILHTCDIICFKFIMYTFRQQKKKRQININGGGGGEQLESVHQFWLNCILCVLCLKLRVVFILCF